ncbi:helix-turn-helix transcriptional regulator [Pelomicrobium sp.]|uniref:helix-turn-helix transcriptional regulator n=1 Tax=Pelomicrobium sp. TaxID=2815319 RepID=UPI002FDCF0DC
MAERDDMILRPNDAAAFLGISRATLYAWEKRLPGFPRRLSLGPRVAGWRLGDLSAWVRERKAAADTRLS